jgi:uncharacterized membrane protein YgaE (UPF0421/DUF939 family)
VGQADDRGLARLLTGIRAQFPPPRRPTRADLRLVVKMIIAGTLAWWLCRLLGAARPLFAVLVPLVAMEGDPFSSVNVSVARVIGVFAGVFIGLGVVGLDLPSTALVALLLALSLAAGLALRVPGGPINNQVAITGMFILYIGAGSKVEPVGVARIWETAIGAGVAVVVSALLWPPDPLREARIRLARLQDWLREDLARARELLAHPDPAAAEEELERVRERSLRVIRDLFELERGERALHWNPRRRTDLVALGVVRAQLTRAARQYRHLRTVSRIIADAATEQPPLASGERGRLVGMISALAPATVDRRAAIPDVDPGLLHDPRAVGLALKLRQMADDLSSA